jgi:hypothetical protein
MFCLYLTCSVKDVIKQTGGNIDRNSRWIVGSIVNVYNDNTCSKFK